MMRTVRYLCWLQMLVPGVVRCIWLAHTLPRAHATYNGVDWRSMTDPNLPAPEAVPMQDAALLARIAQGDETALAALYDRNVRLIFTVALRITADRQTAEEVVQDVFQHIWQSAHTYQPERGAASTWLLGITRHRAIDTTRSRRERARTREQTFDPQLHDGASAAPDKEVDERLQRETMRAALGALPPSQRQAIEMAYYAGLTRSEIADSIGEPVGTVKTRLRLGLLKLRDLIRPTQEEHL